MPADTYPSILAPGSLITDRLAVVRRIGAGGLGEVYLAQHKYTRHHRAVKVLHARFRQDAEVVERFLREASAAGRIGNPHIVETFDAGHLADGSPFIVMEFLEGRPLNEALRKAGRLEVGLASAVMMQVCTALQAAHDASIIHRDLKPENLFLTERDGRAFVKVLDFGISKFQPEEGEKLSSTRSNMTMGTPLYMAPEQLRSAKTVDARSDVYALGVILYELVSGTVPYEAESFAELAVKVLGGRHQPLHLVDGAVPPEVSAMVGKAMHLDPGLRYQSARELGEALAPFARNQSVIRLVSSPDAAPTEQVEHPDTLPRPLASDPAQLGRATPHAPGAAVSRSEPPTEGRRRLAWSVAAGLMGALVLVVVVALRVQKAPEGAPSSPQPDHPAAAAVAQPPEPVLAQVTPLPAAPTPTVSEPASAPPEPAPLRVAPPRTAASPGVAKRARPLRALAQPPAAAGVMTGEAQFHCNPADTVCRVSVDGRDLGETDLTETLPVGEHTAVFTSEQHLQRTRRFRIEPGAPPVKVIAEY
jgi:serine/threonine-protein kinase